MKNKRSLLFIAALSAAFMPLSGCAKNDSVSSAVQDTKAAAKDIAADVKNAAVDSWDAIKDYTYEKRADFSASIDRMAAKHDAEIAAANAKVKGLPDAAAKERDHANKEFADARANLKAALANPEKQLIVETLESHGWNRQDTADALGINRTTLYKKMKKHGISFEKQLMMT